jgi:glycyl-tRNA synthetase
LAHYANAAVDIEYDFPFGFKEVEGIHSRTDFDLSRHSEFSGRKVQYFDPETNESYTPYVVETSVGLDRLFLAVLSTALDEEVLEDGSTRSVLRLPYAVAPTQVAILPLLKKDGLPELAQKVYEELRWDFQVSVDEKDAIGKRYRRQDAVGTPYCITVDHQSIDDQTVTLRDRDSMKQERLPISELSARLHASVSMTSLLKKLA